MNQVLQFQAIFLNRKYLQSMQVAILKNSGLDSKYIR